jgi:serine/threonine-protein phosphatase Stp1
MSFKSAALTHVGLVRESNQDAFVCRDDLGLWAVADGMGGHKGGDLASRTVVRHLESLACCDDFERLLDATRTALNQANAELVGMNAPVGLRSPPGTTVAVLLVHGSRGAAVWAGDSRVYRLRGGETRLVTRDHSHVQDLVDEAVIRPDEAETHPMAHVITRAVGIDDDLALETAPIDVHPGDRFLLCSDGLSRLVDGSEIARKLQSASMKHAAQALLDAALEGGAPDNVTVVAIECI